MKLLSRETVMMFLSFRHLFARKKQSALILLGIVIGTAAFVTISGMMLGFQTKLLDQLVNNDAHIRISAREDLLTAESMNSFPHSFHVFWSIPPSGRKDSAKIENPLGWFQILNRDSEVIAYSPQVNINVMITRGKLNLAGKMIGSVPTKQVRITNIEKYMVHGAFSDLANGGNKIIIGKGLLNNLGARISETIIISTGIQPPQPFKIVGVFEVGMRMTDDTTIFAAITDVQKLRGGSSEITDIAVKISDYSEAENKSKTWKLFSLDKVMSWQESSEGILSVFKTQNIVRNSMTIAIIVVAGFGIYNILSILVNQKKRDIAILRSMGYTPKDIVTLFFYQGLLLGLVGGIIGLILGYFICRYIATIEVVPGRFGPSSNHMIVSFNYMIYVKAFLIANTSALISSILPAREAGKLEPIEIIRSGGQ